VPKTQARTIGIMTVTSMSDYMKQVKRINDDYFRRTGIRFTLSSPLISEICFRCAHVKAECKCDECYPTVTEA
jgi:hypothetical protein